jgi:hypothetical protein
MPWLSRFQYSSCARYTLDRGNQRFLRVPTRERAGRLELLQVVIQLWQAHAGVLWQRFCMRLRRELAKAADIRVRDRKVAEYQRRGLVHPVTPATSGAPRATFVCLARLKLCAFNLAWHRALTTGVAAISNVMTFGVQTGAVERNPAREIAPLTEQRAETKKRMRQTGRATYRTS